MTAVFMLCLAAVLLHSSQSTRFGGNSKSLTVNDVIELRDDVACSADTMPRELTNETGWFNSPNFPDNYPNNANCQWLIKLTDTPVELNFEYFSTERVLDKVTIYDGDSTNAPVLADFNGPYAQPPVEIRSTEPLMLISFTTDFSVNFPGFNASYRAYVPDPELPDPCSPLWRPLEMDDYNGTFQSNGFPDAYWNSADCQWLFVSQEPDGIVEVNFDWFGVEANYDFVRVYDGRDINAPLLGSITGNPPRPPITVFQSSQQYLFVRFTSDVTAVDIGFNGTYTSLPAPSYTGASTEFTTTPPSTTTVTPRPAGPCGTTLNVSPDEATISPLYDVMCHINQSDVDYLSTRCYDLIQNLPDIGNADLLVRQGGNFGCFLTPNDGYTDSERSCVDNYQWQATLGQCLTCHTLFVCIRYK